MAGICALSVSVYDRFGGGWYRGLSSHDMVEDSRCVPARDDRFRLDSRVCGDGSSGGGGPAPSTMPTGMTQAQEGTRPRDNSHTQSADLYLVQAQSAADAADEASKYQLALQSAEAGIMADPNNPKSYFQAAQAMDALSSQAALAGYYAALLGATQLARILPMMTTAVGSIRPARCLVMGLGVAGLQALATARRLGAITEGYDVRPETKEQAESLGAKFVDTGVDARGEGGYARELTADEKAQIASVVTKHIQQADIVITTAAIPGRPSPKLISKAQVDGMKLGAVIIDLAAEGGGNCEYSVPGQTVTQGQITIAAPLNVPSMLAEHASELYAKNLLNLLQLFIVDGAIALNWDDEILAKTVLTHNGEIKPEAVKTALAQH